LVAWAATGAVFGEQYEGGDDFEAIDGQRQGVGAPSGLVVGIGELDGVGVGDRGRDATEDGDGQPGQNADCSVATGGKVHGYDRCGHEGKGRPFRFWVRLEQPACSSRMW
jgi:hypothetical protein